MVDNSSGMAHGYEGSARGRRGQTYAIAVIPKGILRTELQNNAAMPYSTRTTTPVAATRREARTRGFRWAIAGSASWKQKRKEGENSARLARDGRVRISKAEKGAVRSRSRRAAQLQIVGRIYGIKK